MKNGELIARPRLVGHRFEHHTLPLDILGDLHQLNKLIVHLAEQSYKKKVNRTRLSKDNFIKSTFLSIESIEEGSVILNICVTAFALIPEPPVLDFYHSAVNQIIQSIVDVNEDREPSLDKKALSYFSKIGRNLGFDESICFPYSKDGKDSYIEFTSDTRKKLLSASNVDRYYGEISIRGEIFNWDKKKSVCQIKTTSGRELIVSVDDSIREVVKVAFDKYDDTKQDPFRKKVFVLLEGNGYCDKNDVVTKVTDVASLEEIDPLDPTAQIEEFFALKDGWLDGEGIAPDPKGLSWLISFFQNEFAESGLDSPYIFPTEEGNISAEWIGENKKMIASLEFDIKNRTGEYLIVSNQEWFDINFRNKVDITEFFKRMQSIYEKEVV